MKAILVCLLLAVCLSEGLNIRPTRHRFAHVKPDAEIECPTEDKHYELHFTYKKLQPAPEETGAQAFYTPVPAGGKGNPDDFGFLWKDNAYNNIDGSKRTKGEKLPYKNLDVCKFRPKSFCGQDFNDATTRFCELQEAKTKKLCCPLNGAVGKITGKQADPKGCPNGAVVAGMPRAFMPQIAFKAEDLFKAWVKTKAGFSDFDYAEATLDLGVLKPSQDEIFADNSFRKVCTEVIFGSTGKVVKKRDKPSAQPPTKPFVCSDNFIFDGHHRWSQAKFCDFVKNCDSVTTIAVYQANKPCTSLIDLVQAEIIYSDWPNKKASEMVKHDNKNMINFEGFVEVEAKFGASAHANAELAGRAYVAQTNAKLAEAGLEMKGGDAALQAIWEHNLKPQLWQ